MQKIKYKIVELNEPTHSIVVRYYTDKVTEEHLASNDRRRPDGSPERTRSDVSITLPLPLPTEEELEKIILQNCPKMGLEIFEKVRDDPNIVMDFRALVKPKESREVEKTVADWENARKPPELTDAQIEALLRGNNKNANT